MKNTKIKNKPLPPRVSNIRGRQFGMLTVIEFLEVRGGDGAVWICKCDCGQEKAIRAGHLKRGCTKSCGCSTKRLIMENIPRTHGASHEKIYQIYINMKRRCYETKNDSYKNYGERGILVCKEWKDSPDSFLNWSFSNGYKEGLSIERIDVNGNYCPENCTWIPKNDQNKNTTRSVYLTAFGETKTIKEWSKDSRCCVAYVTLARRFRTMEISGEDMLSFSPDHFGRWSKNQCQKKI